jgi:ABC-type dipeptide/oligopeptide/nickel transport system permease component
VLSALRRGSVFDRAAMGVALAGVSLPIFFTGLLSLAIFSYWLGITAPGGSFTPFEENPLLWAYDLLLPWITLGVPLRGRVRAADRGRACSTRWGRTTSAPRGPRACRSARSS